jgi:hypothetical protein
LNALDRERHLLDEPLQKVEGVGACGAAIDAERLVAAAIVDRGVLVDAKPDLADVHLDTVPGERAAVAACPLAPPARPLENLLVVADECPIDCVERQRQIVLPDQLIVQLFDAEPPLSAEP